MPEYQSNWTLGEIEGHDAENLKQLTKKQARTYTFKTVKDVQAFTMEAINKALEKHGISLHTAAEYGMSKGKMDTAGDAFQYLMDEKNVRVEERMQYEGEDAWRCGVYIYKDNEIADFLQAPRKTKNVIISNELYVVNTTIEL
jgi:hypothetical protein